MKLPELLKALSPKVDTHKAQVGGAPAHLVENWTPWVGVKSSNVARARFDEKEGRMEIVFNNGRLYTYSPVALSVWERFLMAPSKGRWVAANKGILKSYRGG